MRPNPFAEFEKPTILIVDDIPANIGVLVDYLEDHEYRVVVAQDGEEALQRAHFAMPDLILLDVMMPGMNGFETCLRLKAMDEVKDIPVIFMTALTDTTDKVHGFEVGGVDYVTKPFQIEEVLARVNAHLALCSMRRKLAEQNERLQEEIAEREQVQTALRLTQYSVDNAADAVFWLNAAGCIDYVNRAACELLQYSPSDLLGQHAFEIEVGNPREQWPAYWKRIKDMGAETVETRVRRQDGGIVPVEVSLCYLAFDGGEHVFCFARDISKRKQAEEALLHTVEQLKTTNRKLEDMHQQLLQSEKMASLGQLAAGVAHEINNPIAFVNANLGTLREYVTGLLELVGLYERGESLLLSDRALIEEIHGTREKLDLAFLREDASHLLSESLDGVQRVRRIVQDLRDFSHVGQAERQPYNLHAGLDSALNILSSEFRDKAEVRKEYGTLPEVDCVPAQVNQVFMGLLMNAVQAVEPGGIVTIRTGAENGAVWVEIEDNGCGIPKEDLQHVFEPFFTTKPPGKGTGLGLSMCYGIVKQHGGRIDIDSEPGRGTRVTVRLATP